ncbi:Rieske 2Fe-2S domain-containing protein [Spirosoma taeanense]|uniref:Rieske 2Fe-2S domain-containing protein n=1 Tax=Spirosoma taeanense TaxID=2735870 RepID=A0A6M5Y379_9BACT|nr:Rieske 2Fe-2S domain-containing protein [Spirosoma taeanense]QJW88185.1 Rieske 2Fe-2S domain-containing protein [Spirosoma taeanense]
MQNNPTTNDSMKRGEFLRSLGLSSAALMAFYCMGTLSSCSGSDDDPAPAVNSSAGLTGNADTTKGAINFTLDLTNADFKALKTEGQYVKAGSVIVANTKGNKYVAIQRLCSHELQDGISYRLASDDFGCSVHGSVFATNGAVKVAVGGPGQPAMKVYKATLSTDGNKLQVSE